MPRLVVLQKLPAETGEEPQQGRSDLYRVSNAGFAGQFLAAAARRVGHVSFVARAVDLGIDDALEVSETSRTVRAFREPQGAAVSSPPTLS